MLKTERGEIKMYLHAKSFNYNKQELPSGYVLATSSSPDLDKDTTIKRTANYGDLTPYRSKPHYYASAYDSVLKFNIFLLRCDGKPMTRQEQINLVRWLDTPDEHCLLTVTDFADSDYHKDLEYFVVPTGYSEYGLANHIYGLDFSFECNAPYPFTKEYIYPIDTTKTLIIDNISDKLSTDVYPIITLKANKTETIKITNMNYADEEMELQVIEGQTLTIDNEYGCITDDKEQFSYSTDTNLEWLHLAPGKNSISFTGDFTGTVKCRYARKVGI